MDLLNVPKRTKIHEFYLKVIKMKVLYFKPVLKFGDLLGGLKFAHNISILPARPKNKETWVFITLYICVAQWLSRYRRGSIKTMRALGLWFEARPDRTLSPGSGQKMGSPWT